MSWNFNQNPSASESDVGSLLKANCGLQSYWPDWDGVAQFRPIPALDSAGNLLPMWANESQTDFTQWRALVPMVVRGAGDGTGSKATFCDFVPGRSSRDTPYGQLTERMRAYCRNDENLKKFWLLGSTSQPAKLPKPGNRFAMQGWLVHHGDRSYATSPKRAVFFLPSSACDRLMEAIAADKTLDIPSPAVGKTLEFKRASSSADTPGAAVNFGAGPAAVNPGGGSGQSFTQSYRVNLIPSGGIDPALCRFWQPWENVINLLSEQEMVDLLCTAFRGDILAFAYKDTRFESMVPQLLRDRWFTVAAMANSPFQMSGYGSVGPGAPSPAAWAGGSVQQPGYGYSNQPMAGHPQQPVPGPGYPQQPMPGPGYPQQPMPGPGYPQQQQPVGGYPQQQQPGPQGLGGAVVGQTQQPNFGSSEPAPNFAGVGTAPMGLPPLQTGGPVTPPAGLTPDPAPTGPGSSSGDATANPGVAASLARMQEMQRQMQLGK